MLVGEATQRAAGGAIVFEAAGDQVLKGKQSPVPAWRAVRVVAQRGGVGRTETLEAPFVGRDEELRQLKDLFHATGREGRPRLVSVIGPAGIGKSRLAWEFLKYVDGLVETVWWHDGRSPAYGEGITFWALGEMIRGRARLQETDDEATTRAAIAAMLEEHVPDEAERAWIEPALLSLLGLESDAGSQQLFGAWRTFFERLAASGPVVMVFEDFHHADTGLLDFVDHLMEWSRNVPILIVTLARPELLERRPDWGAGKRSFTSIHLEPLSTAAMRELLAGLVPGLPAHARDAIVARADGVPLYAVETVRMLLAQGRLVLEDGVYRPSGDLSALAVPETLTALISARLDELDAADRALVADAAVLGQSFTPAGGRGGVGRGRRRASSRGCGRSSGASCSSSRSTRARPSAASTRSSRRSSARSPTTRSRSATARSAISPRPASSSRSRPTSWPGRWPATTWRPTATRPTGPRPTRWPPRRGWRCAARPSGRPPSARTPRRSRSSSTPSRSARTRPTAPTSTSGRSPRRCRAWSPRSRSGTGSAALEARRELGDRERDRAGDRRVRRGDRVLRHRQASGCSRSCVPAWEEFSDLEETPVGRRPDAPAGAGDSSGHGRPAGPRLARAAAADRRAPRPAAGDRRRRCRG